MIAPVLPRAGGGVGNSLGGIAALVQALNLLIGVGFEPIEWEWTYGMLSLLGLVFLSVPAGRALGIDAFIRPRLQTASEKGNRLAKLLLLFT